MSEKKQPVDLGLLEEDDEFEEFPAEGAGWGGDGKRGSLGGGGGSAGRPRPGPGPARGPRRGRNVRPPADGSGGGARARFVSGSPPAEQLSGSARRCETSLPAAVSAIREQPLASPHPTPSEVRGCSPVRVGAEYGRAACAQLRCVHDGDAGHTAFQVLCHGARELETSARETCCISALEMRITGERG